MTTKRTVRITIDTSRLLIVLRGTATRSWCQQCAGEVDMVPVESAADMVQVDVQTFQHLMAREEFHRSQSGAPVLICLNSLLKSIQHKSLESGFNTTSGTSVVER